MVPAPIKDNVSFGVSLGFDSKTIKFHNKECSSENLRWQLLKFFIETVDEMGILPYRFIYKALRKCKKISLAEELVEYLKQDQDLMSIGVDYMNFDINELSNVLCLLYFCVTFQKFCVFSIFILLIFSSIIIYP